MLQTRMAFPAKLFFANFVGHLVSATTTQALLCASPLLPKALRLLLSPCRRSFAANGPTVKLGSGYRRARASAAPLPPRLPDPVPFSPSLRFCHMRALCTAGPSMPFSSPLFCSELATSPLRPRLSCSILYSIKTSTRGGY